MRCYPHASGSLEEAVKAAMESLLEPALLIPVPLLPYRRTDKDSGAWNVVHVFGRGTDDRPRVLAPSIIPCCATLGLYFLFSQKMGWKSCGSSFNQKDGCNMTQAMDGKSSYQPHRARQKCKHVKTAPIYLYM